MAQVYNIGYSFITLSNNEICFGLDSVLKYLDFYASFLTTLNTDELIGLISFRTKGKTFRCNGT